MTAEAQSMALPMPRVAARKNWIESPLFDLTFFTLSPLVTLPIVLATFFVHPRFGILLVVLAFPHYLSTGAFFFWDEYKDRLRARWLAFFGGPVIIAAVYALLITSGLPKIMQVTLFLWNTVHVSRQSCGILSIYRHRAGVFDQRQKSVTNFAIISTCLFLSFWNIETHDAFDPLYALVPNAASLMRWGLAVPAVAGLLWLGYAMWQRSKEGKGVGFSESAFLLTSLLLFTPYLFIPTSVSATAVMLLPHYVQYLGIVWLLHRRRFRAADGSLKQRTLQKVSSNLPLLLATLTSIGLAAAAFKVVAGRLDQIELFETFYLLVAFEHFYLDGLVWAFRDPAVRKSFGPYLTGYDPDAVLEAA